MYTIYELQHEINKTVANTLSVDDLFAVRVSCIALMPLCWATDVAQSDSATIAIADGLLKTVRDQYLWLKRVKVDAETARTLAELAGIATASMDNRKSFFENDILKMYRCFSDPNAEGGTQMSNEKLHEVMMSYFKQVNMPVSAEVLAAEVGQRRRTEAAHPLPPMEERIDGPLVDRVAMQWNQPVFQLRHPWSCTFVSMLSSVMLTEAAVERVFWTLGRAMRPDRCRIENGLVDKLTMIKLNAHKLGLCEWAGETSTKLHTVRVMRCAEWRDFVLTTAAAPVPERQMLTRRAERETLREVEQQVIYGSKLDFQFIVDDELRWCSGLVMAVLSPQEVVIAWRPEVANVSAKRKTTATQTLRLDEKDLDWRFTPE